MNTRRCLQIAARINALLVREVGQGIDPARMLAEPLYARDVLLVCEALRDSELAELAPRFRLALAAPEPENSGSSGSTGQPSGFNASRFLNSLFGQTTGSPAHTLNTPAAGAPAKPARSWFGRLGK